MVRRQYQPPLVDLVLEPALPANPLITLGRANAPPRGTVANQLYSGVPQSKVGQADLREDVGRWHGQGQATKITVQGWRE